MTELSAELDDLSGLQSISSFLIRNLMALTRSLSHLINGRNRLLFA